ncbi:MAG: hypothetical protein ACJAXX_000929 [Roseivirga sp.]|jgi:hypothetical protein
MVVNFESIINTSTNKHLRLIALLFIFFTACVEDDEPTAADCNPQVCFATVGTDEITATAPVNWQGAFAAEFTFAVPDSLIAQGSEATFTFDYYFLGINSLSRLLQY